jgi:purine-nucleoside phosphorylase
MMIGGKIIPLQPLRQLPLLPGVGKIMMPVIRDEMTRMADQADRCVETIRTRIGNAPIDVGLILGGALTGLADQVGQAVAIPYGELPGFPRPAAEPKPELVTGLLGTARVAVFRGRSNYNEAGDINAMRVPVQTLARLGGKALVTIGAAGAIRPDLPTGSIVTVTDHINMTGLNPLVGEAGAERFVDLIGVYDRHLRERFALATGQLGRKAHDGVYMFFPGPSFETPADIRAAQALGADMVGMAIVPEVILGRRCGLRVLALAMITNLAAGARQEPLTLESRARTSAASAQTLTRLLSKFFEIWVLEGRARPS